jgi:hypothetical protein
MCAPHSNEAIRGPILLSQEEENEVSHFPFHVFDNTLFYDSEGEDVRDSLDELDSPCYEKSNDTVDNIDEFIHVG